MSVHVLKRTVAPSAAPTVVGSHWVDTTTSKQWLAMGTATVADWVEITQGDADWGEIGGTLSNQTDLQTALDAKVVKNANITGATKTKITYDAKGLVTGGADAAIADITGLATAIAGLVPYTGATADLDLGAFYGKATQFWSGKYYDSSGIARIELNVGGGGYWSGNTELNMQYSTNFMLYNNSYYTIEITANNFVLRDPVTGTDSINVYTKHLIDSGGNTSLNYTSKELYVNGTISMDWSGRALYDSSGTGSIYYASRLLLDQVGTTRVDWENGILRYGNGNDSVLWNNASLHDSSGNETANWNGRLLSDMGLSRLSWSGMELIRGSNVTSLNWDLGFLYWNNGSQHVVADWSTQKLFDIADQTSLDWGQHLAYASDGSTVILNFNNVTGGRFGASIQVGRTDTAPVSAIHVDKGNATASALKFTAGTTTGLTSTDGFNVGITSAGVAEIRQYENLDLKLYTNNTLRKTYLAAGGETLTDAYNISVGTTTGTKIGTATSEKLAFHNSTPVVQRSGAAQAATAATAATNIAPFGFTTAAQADAIVTLVNEIRATLVEKGIFKGSA